MAEFLQNELPQGNVMLIKVNEDVHPFIKSATLKVLNFAGIKFLHFHDF